MLSALEKLPWDRLHCACGSAAHVPDSLRGLLSTDPVVVESSYWQLENHVVVQGNLFDTAIHILPALLEGSASAPYPFAILRLLFEIGNSWSDGPDAPACYHLVMRGLEDWLATNPASPLREAIVQDLADLRSFHTAEGQRLQ